MGLIVQKFGGSSVKDCSHLFNAAHIIANTQRAGNDVVVVVSAQGDTTDDLMEKAAEITLNPPERELDVLLSTGEQVSIALLAMALNQLGCDAISLTGWQAGFCTDTAYTKARINQLDCARITNELERGKIVIVAGFQGLNKQEDITTLGRGGSDTSAVAIAAALHADRCQIYTDVKGVYTADPRKVPTAKKLAEITFDEMLELSALGNQVLNSRSVELAKKYDVKLEVLSSLQPTKGTIVQKASSKMEGVQIKGVTCDAKVAVITLHNQADNIRSTAFVLNCLAQQQINVDFLSEAEDSAGGKKLRFAVAASEADKAVQQLQASAGCCAEKIHVDADCAKVSIVGAGIQSHVELVAAMFQALAEQDIPVKMVCVGEVKASVIVARAQADSAVGAIHNMLIDS